MLKHTKKDLIIALYRRGIQNVDRIAAAVRTRPSYVASVLQHEGLLKGYNDLYTSTNAEQNAYSKYFRGILSFRTVEAAKESVSRIAKLYDHFERLGDRAGQHHAQVIALTGRNRARWSGKIEEAKVFMDWLATH